VNLTTSVAEAQRFVEITQQLEQGGEAARAEVIRAQIDLRTRQSDLQEAQVNLEKAKIALGVIIFPALRTDFTVVDDVQQVSLLPPLLEIQAGATSSSPDVRAAMAGVDQASQDIRVARYGYLPSLGVDVLYGVDANRLAYRTRTPDESFRNLGYSAMATLTVPVWNWGAIRSKVKQAEIRRDQAQLDLSLSQRALQGDAATLYAEARNVLSRLETLRTSLELATESLRLTLLRYQAGEATALEVVDAQIVLTQARNLNDDGLARYRVAIATLQVLMGTL
jgi:outer membrane protein TolC